MMDSQNIKEKAFAKGADVCGIAPVTRFAEAPEGFHPCDIFPECKSVVVYASRFPNSVLEAKGQAPYTFVRNMMVAKLDNISFQLVEGFGAEGVTTIPIPSSEPYEYWDPDRNHGRGIISLKHAAVLAGVGVIGKNTLLVNEAYGNMIWLGAVLLPLELEADPIASYEPCIPECILCIDSCPQGALDGVTINQKSCRERSAKSTGGGGWVLSCNTCRVVCPNCEGLQSTDGENSVVSD